MVELFGNKFVARRKRLVELLRQKGITSERVLTAIQLVPRERFMPASMSELAYEDKAFPIGAEQTISQPYTVARETDLLCLQGEEKVLEIGTGSGYQTAVLLECGCRVYSIERISSLHQQAKERLVKLDYTPVLKEDDGHEGWLTYAPFDRIIITAGCKQLPQKLLGQLAVGGIMVLPIEKSGELRLCRIERKSETDFQSEFFESCAFVPMLEGVVK